MLCLLSSYVTVDRVFVGSTGCWPTGRNVADRKRTHCFRSERDITHGLAILLLPTFIRAQLHRFAEYGNVDTVALLLKAKVNVNSTDSVHTNRASHSCACSERRNCITS